jgi:hypothetical protein
MRNFFKAVVVPWGSLFLLSGTLAFGLDRALVRGASEHPSFDEEVAVSIVGTWHSPTLPPPTEPATRWVFLSSANHQGAEPPWSAWSRSIYSPLISSSWTRRTWTVWPPVCVVTIELDTLISAE